MTKKKKIGLSVGLFLAATGIATAALAYRLYKVLDCFRTDIHRSYDEDDLTIVEDIVEKLYQKER